MKSSLHYIAILLSMILVVEWSGMATVMAYEKAEADAQTTFNKQRMFVRGYEQVAAEAMFQATTQCANFESQFADFIVALNDNNLLTLFPSNGNAIILNGGNQSPKQASVSVPVAPPNNAKDAPPAPQKAKGGPPVGSTPETVTAKFLGFPAEVANKIDQNPDLSKLLKSTYVAASVCKPYQDAYDKAESTLQTAYSDWFATGKKLAATPDIGARLETHLVWVEMQIRRATGISLHTTIPDNAQDPQCAGDVLTDQTLSDIFKALANGEQTYIARMGDYLKKLACLDVRQVLALDRGIGVAFTKVAIAFHAPEDMKLRKRLLESLYLISVPVADIDKFAGPTSAWAIVEVLGDKTINTSDNWILDADSLVVKNGVAAYNRTDKTVTSWPICTEAAPLPPQVIVNNNLINNNGVVKNAANGVPIPASQQLVQASNQMQKLPAAPVSAAVASKPVASSSKDMFKSPFGKTISELTPIICPAKPIPTPVGGWTKALASDTVNKNNPAAGGGGCYPLAIVGDSFRADHVGFGTCGLTDMVSTRVCKAIVCDAGSPANVGGGSMGDPGANLSLPSSNNCSYPIGTPNIGSCLPGGGSSQKSLMSFDNNNCAMQPTVKDGGSGDKTTPGEVYVGPDENIIGKVKSKDADTDKTKNFDWTAHPQSEKPEKSNTAVVVGGPQAPAANALPIGAAASKGKQPVEKPHFLEDDGYVYQTLLTPAEKLQDLWTHEFFKNPGVYPSIETQQDLLNAINYDNYLRDQYVSSQGNGLKYANINILKMVENAINDSPYVKKLKQDVVKTAQDVFSNSIVKSAIKQVREKMLGKTIPSDDYDLAYSLMLLKMDGVVFDALKEPVTDSGLHVGGWTYSDGSVEIFLKTQGVEFTSFKHKLINTAIHEYGLHTLSEMLGLFGYAPPDNNAAGDSKDHPDHKMGQTLEDVLKIAVDGYNAHRSTSPLWGFLGGMLGFVLGMFSLPFLGAASLAITIAGGISAIYFTQDLMYSDLVDPLMGYQKYLSSGGQNGSSSGSASSGGSSAKECDPMDPSCGMGPCQPLQLQQQLQCVTSGGAWVKAAMKAIGPGPISNPVPTEGSDGKFSPQLVAYMACMGGGSVSADTCSKMDCAPEYTPTIVGGQCKCTLGGAKDRYRGGMPDNSCAMVMCVDGSTNPCCQKGGDGSRGGGPPINPSQAPGARAPAVPIPSQPASAPAPRAATPLPAVPAASSPPPRVPSSPIPAIPPAQRSSSPIPLPR